MREKLSTECQFDQAVLGTRIAAWETTTRTRSLLLLANYLPLLHAAAVVALLVLPTVDWGFRAAVAVAVLYLAPPILSRALRTLLPLNEGRIQFGGSHFLRWWVLFQLQGLFNRFAVLEELLRLVPGLYSVWLRLWGAKIGRLTYWAPGTLILDRPFVEIGNDVVFGAGVRLNPHVMAKNEAGKQELLLATVRIGAGAIIGGYSLLTAGTEISPGEATRAFLLSPPFSVWKNGKRIHKASE